MNSDFNPRNLHTYVLKIQGTKIVGMLDSGAMLNCISQQLVDTNKLKVIKYDKPFDLGQAVKGKVHVTSYTEVSYKIGSFLSTMKLSIIPTLATHEIILGLPWLQDVNPLIPNWSTGDLFITKTKVNGKRTTYRCKSIQSLPYTIPENCPTKPTSRSTSHKPTKEVFNTSDSTEVFCLWVRSVDDYSIQSLSMAQAAEQALQFAENQSEFYTPAFEEPPLYKLSEPHTPHEQAIIDKLIKDNASVLRTTLPPGLPPKRPGDGPIAPLMPGTAPVSKAAFKLSPNENAEIKRQLQEYFDSGQLIPSHSPWGAPVFLVRKAHSTKLRMVCDWRALNKVTIKDKFAMPHPDMLFDKLKGAKYFTKLDLSQGFHQLLLSKEDREKSAITTRYGNFEWTVASFGMTNVPAVFSRVVGSVLWEFQDDFVINFMDDILIYSQDFDTHISHIQKVLTKLNDAQLYANPEKCTWCATSAFYLGHEISAEGIRVSKEKIQSITSWPTPKNVKELRSFLGLASYYRKFVKNFAFIAEPLTKLLAKDQKWAWSKNSQHSAFRELQKQLTEAPVLLFPDFDLPFTLQTDSSGYAIGGVLLQDQGHGLQPVAYESRKMIPAETRYPVHEQELLAILFCCKKWRHYILNNNTEVVTDHAPLKYIHSQPNISSRQARWLDFLAQYDLNIIPMPGKFNTVADALSRRCDYVSQLWSIYHNSDVYSLNVISTTSLSSRVNETFTSQPEINELTQSFEVMNLSVLDNSKSESQLLLTITKAYKQDLFVRDLLLGKVKSIPTSHGKYVLLNGIVYYYTKDSQYLLYIPSNAILEGSKVSLQEQIIHECHDALYAGHFGSAKTLSRIQSQFHWFNLHKDVALYCNTCISCKRNKPPNRKPPGLLQPHDIPFRPWHTISLDFITHLPMTADGYDTIMVVVDLATKRGHFIATTSTVTSQGVAQLFFDTVWKAHGLPINIISDRDTKFTSGFWQTLWRLLGTRLKMSTAFSAQTDGQTERLNRTLEEYLRNYIDAHQSNWAQLLTPAEYAYNSAPVTTLDGLSPFQLDTGQQPNDPLYLFQSAATYHAAGNQVINSLDDYLQQFKLLRQRATDALTIAKRNQKVHYDLRHRQEEFYLGDMVYLSTKRYRDYGSVHYASKGTATVFEPRNLGPFKIIQKVSSHAYKLELPPSFKIHPVIHIRYLSKSISTDRFSQRNPLPGPEIVMDDGNVEFEVESILKHRIRKYGRGSRLEYLIHWKGYQSDDDTWEPLRNLTNCPDIVRDYNQTAGLNLLQVNSIECYLI